MSATFAALVVSALASAPPRTARQEITARFFLDTTLTTETARAGDPVPLRTAGAFLIDGVAIAGGSRAHGVVVDVDRPGRIRGRGAITIQIVSLTRPGGAPLRVNGTLRATAPRAARTLPPDPEAGIIAGMAAGYGTAALVSKVSHSSETIGRAGIIAGVTTGVLVGVLKRGDDLVLPRGAAVEITFARTPPAP